MGLGLASVRYQGRVKGSVRKGVPNRVRNWRIERTKQLWFLKKPQELYYFTSVFSANERNRD